MSDQDEDAERELDDALDAILGPAPKGSVTDVLRPIERENLRRDLEAQKRTYAAASRAARIEGMHRKQKRLEDGIAHLRSGHPLRLEPEARIAELKTALIAALESPPSDPSGISIVTATSHSFRRDLSTEERPTEADIASGVLGTTIQRHGQSTRGNTDRELEPNEGRNAKKHVRRNPKYVAIDEALRAIAEARPPNHEFVFRFLDDRKVSVPHRKPFKVAGGWVNGFQKDRYAARAWLSQAWSRLGLPAFARGSKK